MCDNWKYHFTRNLFGVVMVSVIPYGDTGLLPTPENLGAYGKHHTLFGISERELRSCLDDTNETDPLNWTKALKILKEKIESGDFGTQKEEFLGYLQAIKPQKGLEKNNHADSSRTYTVREFLRHRRGKILVSWEEYDDLT